MTWDNFLKGQLMGVAVREGLRHGGINNSMAIAHVMRNRVHAGWHGGDWLQVLTNTQQALGTVYEETPKIDPRSVEFRSILQRIDDVYNGSSEDLITDGSLYYCELHNVNRPWFQAQILADPTNHPRLASCGPVTFFG